MRKLLYTEYVRNCEEYGIVLAAELLYDALYSDGELMEDDIEEICEDFELCYRADHWTAAYIELPSNNPDFDDVPF